MRYFASSWLLVALGCSLLACTDAEKAPVTTEPLVPHVKAYDAQVMLPLAGVQLPQVFVRLQNTGDKEVSLVKATSAMATEIEIMQMQPQRPDAPVTLVSLPLPAKTLVDLHKAGPYLLLKNLDVSLQTGDQLPITLGFSDNTQIEITAIAKSAFDQPHHH